jgi:hypothetical protein
MSAASRSIIINFKGSISGLVNSTRRAVAEMSSVGNAAARIGGDLTQALLHGNLKPILSDVVGGLEKMASTVLAMPGLLLALVNPMNILSMATLNFSDAISASSPEAFVAATRNMAPAMRDAVMAVRLLEPQIKNLYGIVQQGFWSGFAGDINTLAQTYLPVLEQGFGRIATALGQLTDQLFKFLLEPQVVSTIQSWMDAFASWLTSLEPFITAAMPTMLTLFEDFGTILEDMLPLLNVLVTVFVDIMNFITPIITGLAGVLSGALGVFGATSSVTGGIGGTSGGGTSTGTGTGSSGGSSSGSSSGSSGSGFFSGIESFFSSIFSHLATGGPALPAHSYLVGEHGPEILTMGSGAGHVTPAVHTGDTHVTVRIGDQELRGIITSEVDRYVTNAAMTARMGRGYYR